MSCLPALVEPPRADTICGPTLESSQPRRSMTRRPVRSTRTGARFDPLLPYETWRDLGARFGTYTNAMSWWLGDWLVFGRGKYGRRYKEAIAATGLDYGTLRNYAVVARRVEPSRRRSDVSFQHHAEVCALDDEHQDSWLARAARGRWSRNELRLRLRAAAACEASVPACEASVRTVRLNVEDAQALRWRDAAEHSDFPLETWVVHVLD